MTPRWQGKRPVPSADPARCYTAPMHAPASPAPDRSRAADARLSQRHLSRWPTAATIRRCSGSNRKRRAILPLDGFHCSHSLARTLRRGRFRVTCNQAFERVIAACAGPRRERRRGESWISRRIAASYTRCTAAATPIRSNAGRPMKTARRLVGGLYGVGFDRVFCGESMFSRANDASKVALAWLVAALRRCRAELLDCQFMTDHLASLGAVEIEPAALSLAAARRPSGLMRRARAVRGAGAGAGDGAGRGDGCGRRARALPLAGRLRRAARRRGGGRIFLFAGELHRAVLDPDIVDRVLDGVERGRILEQPARKHRAPGQRLIWA